MTGLLIKNIITNFSNVFEQLNIHSIDQEWAWSQLIGRSINIGKKFRYCSPLRPDSSPGVWFEYHNSILLIVDFADKPNSHLNCVTAWSRVKGIHWKKALREIYDKQGVRVIRQVKDKVKEVEKIITIRECWEQRHEDYWLIRGGKPDFVKGVSSYTIHGTNTRTWLVEDLCFAYVYVEGKVKLYFPNRGKDEQRFISNLKPQDVFLRYVDETLLISKAAKDYSELLHVWEHSITHVQCENCWHEMVDRWKVFETKIIYLDADRAGLKNAYELAKEIKGQIIFNPTLEALEIISKMEKDFINYLPSNLSNLVGKFMCDRCTDSISIDGYSIFAMLGMKDFDNIKTNPDLDEVRIFNWLLT